MCTARAAALTLALPHIDLQVNKLRLLPLKAGQQLSLCTTSYSILAALQAIHSVVFPYLLLLNKQLTGLLPLANQFTRHTEQFYRSLRSLRNAVRRIPIPCTRLSLVLTLSSVLSSCLFHGDVPFQCPAAPEPRGKFQYRSEQLWPPFADLCRPRQVQPSASELVP